MEKYSELCLLFIRFIGLCSTAAPTAATPPPSPTAPAAAAAAAACACTSFFTDTHQRENVKVRREGGRGSGRGETGRPPA